MRKSSDVPGVALRPRGLHAHGERERPQRGDERGGADGDRRAFGGIEGPTAIAVASGAVWVGLGDETVRRIDPTTRRVGPPIRLGGFVHELAVGFGALWAATADPSLERVDPRTGGVRRIEANWTPNLFTVGAGAVSVGDYS